MNENIIKQKNFEKIPKTNEELEKYLLLAGAYGTGHEELTGESLVEKYRNLTPEAKKIAFEEIVRYIRDHNTLDIVSPGQKEREIAEGADEIMDDAMAGRRIRLEPDELGINEKLNEEKLKEIERKLEEEKLKEEKEEKTILERIRKNYEKLFTKTQ